MSVKRDVSVSLRMAVWTVSVIQWGVSMEAAVTMDNAIARFEKLFDL